MEYFNSHDAEIADPHIISQYHQLYERVASNLHGHRKHFMKIVDRFISNRTGVTTSIYDVINQQIRQLSIELVEFVDGIEILISQGASRNCELQLRSIFDISATICYLLGSDYEICVHRIYSLIEKSSAERKRALTGLSPSEFATEIRDLDKLLQDDHIKTATKWPKTDVICATIDDEGELGDKFVKFYFGLFKLASSIAHGQHSLNRQRVPIRSPQAMRYIYSMTYSLLEATNRAMLKFIDRNGEINIALCDDGSIGCLMKETDILTAKLKCFDEIP